MSQYDDAHLPADIYLFKVNNRKTTARYEICSESIIKTREGCHWRRCGVFIVTFEHILDIVVKYVCCKQHLTNI